MRSATQKEIDFINNYRSKEELSPDDVYVESFLLANSNFVPKYSMFLHPKALKQTAEKAGRENWNGLNFKVMHSRDKVVSLGKSFAGAYDKDTETVYAKFYFPKGLSENGYNVDDLIKGINSGIYAETSWGFSRWPVNEKSIKCSLCGGNPIWFRSYLGGKGEWCGHAPGDSYKATEAMVDFVNKMKSEGMDSYPGITVRENSDIECRMWMLDTEDGVDELSIVDRGASDSRPVRENEIPVKFSVAKDSDMLKLVADKSIDTMENTGFNIVTELKINEGEGMEGLNTALTHNSKLSKSEPGWGSVDKTKLPRSAHAVTGEPDKKTSWKYPHHHTEGSSKTNDMGVYTDGTMYLNRGGLRSALQRASQFNLTGEPMEHLQRHKKAIGMGAMTDQDAIKALEDSILGNNDDIELLGGQNKDIGGDKKVSKSLFDRIFNRGLKAEIDEGIDNADMKTTVEPNEKVVVVDKDLMEMKATLSSVGFDGNDLTAFLKELKHKSDGYASIPEEIVSKIEKTELTWAIVADYVKVCQRELDSICTDLVNAAVAVKGDVNKEELVSEVTTKARIFGIEAALDFGRKAIKAYQAEQSLKPGQKTVVGTVENDSDKQKKDEALIALANASLKRVNRK